MEEKLYQVALTRVPGIGDVTIKNLISYSGSAHEVFKSKKSLLLKIPGIGEKTAISIQLADPLKDAEAILEQCKEKDIQILHYTQSAYPERLKSIADAPSILYLKGNAVLGNYDKRYLAIVGTRNATHYGKEVTESITQSCSELKATIISGLAYGIDIHAHRTGLAHGVSNIAVLAGGLDKIYPTVHQSVANEIMENGLLISENPPGTKAEAHYFPARNRIIAGLSDAVIVVEAAAKGGALITANIADSYNKPVFAVPGDLNNKYSAGCNYLIRNQKACIYTGPEDLVYYLNWDAELGGTQPKAPNYDSLPDSERKICELLQESQSLPIDELAWKTQITINELASLLLSLEFQGIIKSRPGKKYELC
ncbi:DNA-processing protein DprA [Marinoscillum sp. MHG1-6]|uniref:DNA-processing protein DprA n=1 Tax=Marinoscillum sp. MHG1-6 TaxID=2959627 RepID=UPI002158785B|nr:DNA-processing protein DprA [Marinoscillum sp. MHG1-6]